jgi:hypothetical protein
LDVNIRHIVFPFLVGRMTEVFSPDTKTAHRSNLVFRAFYKDRRGTEGMTYSRHSLFKLNWTWVGQWIAFYSITLSFIAILRPQVYLIENNTWVRGNTRFISSVEHDISRVSAANEWDIMFNTRNKSVFPSTHVFFCLLYKQNSVKNNKTSVAMRFTTNYIFTRKNIVFFTFF